MIHLADLELIMDVMIDSVVLTTSLCNGTKLERKMVFAQEKITYLRGLKEKKFFELLRARGVPQDQLTSHPDAQYYIQVLGNGLYYDNGSQSLISQLRRNLRGNDYGDDPNRSDKENANRQDEFIASFMDSAWQRWKRFFMDNYRTNVMNEHGVIRKRVITSEDLYDIDFEPVHVAEVREIFSEIFKNAREIDASVEIEKRELETRRKAKIHQIIEMRQKGGKP